MDKMYVTCSCGFVSVVVSGVLLLSLVNSGVPEYVNSTTNYFGKNFNEGFQFSTRIPKKPFTKKNNFLSFETKDENIEVGFEFSVPFLTVPVKRSVENVRNSVMTPLANINSGAIFLAGVMVAAGVTTAYIWRTFAYLHDPSYGRFLHSRIKKDVTEEKFWQILDSMDKLLLKYNIDSTACSQRIICSMVKESAESVASGNGTSADKILDGITCSSWLLNWTKGTAVNDAMRTARENRNCQLIYPACKLKDDSIGGIFETFMKMLI